MSIGQSCAGICHIISDISDISDIFSDISDKIPTFAIELPGESPDIS
ncbi:MULTISPECIES: hypothetical protein [unclassified Microcoleus]